MIALLAALALAADPSVKPWPIGVGADYQPAAAAHAVGSLRCGASRQAFAVHLELFANRRAVVIPAGIGVGPRTCVYPVRTLTPTGVVGVARAGLTLGDVFHVWGQLLSTHTLASFTSGTPVRAYVNGHLVRGAASSIPLTPGAQIVLELGGYVPPHGSFLFPRGSS